VVVLIGIAGLWYVSTLRLNYSEQEDNSDALRLMKRFDDLTAKKQEALKNNDVSGAAALDKQIEAVEAESDALFAQKREQQELVRKAEEARTRLEQEKKLREEAIELAKKCDAVKEKKMVDLTTYDLELLKTCGAPAPYLPIR